MTNKPRKVQMTKQDAIKKLNKKFKNYNLNVETAGNAGQGVFTVKAFIQVFELNNEGKQPQVVKNATGYGFNTSIDEAQNKAIIEAVENLGL